MSLFDRFFSATIILAVLLIVSPSSPPALSEQLGSESFPSTDASKDKTAKFAPPEFDYDPIPATAPLVKASTWQDIGENAVLTGDYPNALAAFNKALQLASLNSPEMLEQRGWIHYSIGNEAAAFQDLSLAAQAHLKQGDLDAHANAVNMRTFVDNQADRHQ